MASRYVAQTRVPAVCRGRTTDTLIAFWDREQVGSVIDYSTTVVINVTAAGKNSNACTKFLSFLTIIIDTDSLATQLPPPI